MSESILVINAGSSSIKYQLIDVDTRAALATGLIERIGEDISTLTHKNLSQAEETKVAVEQPLPTHTDGLRAMLSLFQSHGPDLEAGHLIGIGHRVVQGADAYNHATLITPDVVASIREFVPLAPLHNPANLMGIEAAQQAFPDLPQVAVFDTAFHQTLPPASFTYAIDPAVAVPNKVRRYGFHGTSHQYVARETAQLMGKAESEVNLITVHIGSGCSITAVRGGRSVETSMGLTPLEGLVMGSRSGDVDPALIFHLVRTAGYSIDQVDELLNKRSGLLGLCGSLDVRDIHKAIAAGDAAARLALDVFTHRLRHYIGAYAAQLGRLDGIVFTAGIGENDPVVRRETLAGLEIIGVELDDSANQTGRGPKLISAPTSLVQVWVVPTNEEYEIAHQTVDVIHGL
ncbi:MAG: acetate kinase [Micrococcales bacterium]|nr:acetate kinase [Micrococcales bacterium]